MLAAASILPCKGTQIHEDILKSKNDGLLQKNPYLASALINMYAKCGVLEKAQEVSEKLHVPDVASWNTLITGYTKTGLGHEALRCFKKMLDLGFSPNIVTYTGVLKACAMVGSLEIGQHVEDDIRKRGLLQRHVSLGNTLLGMYSSCCLMDKAREVFDNLEVRNVVSWTALMAGYAQIGQIENVFHIYDEMIGDGIQPNQVTFVVILNACSRLGQLHKSLLYFHMMSKDYCIAPTIEHHSCMIDLAGRIGQLDKATTMIEEMPFRPNLVVWHSLLGACQKSGNLSTGKWAFEYSTDAILAVS